MQYNIHERQKSMIRLCQQKFAQDLEPKQCVDGEICALKWPRKAQGLDLSKTILTFIQAKGHWF